MYACLCVPVCACTCVFTYAHKCVHVFSQDFVIILFFFFTTPLSFLDVFSLLASQVIQSGVNRGG